MAAMISVTKLRTGVCFLEGKSPYRVLDYKHKHLSRGSGTIKVKVANLNSGQSSTKTFKSGDKVEEIEVTKQKLQFLYTEDKNYLFMDPTSFEQISVSEKVIGEQGAFLKEGEEVEVLVWDEQVLDVNLPPKLDYRVEEAAPGEKGNSASNVYKDAKLENGMKIRVPLFVNKGDRVRVDTRTGEYVERA